MCIRDSFEIEGIYVHHFDRTDLKTFFDGNQFRIFMTEVDHYGLSSSLVLDAFIFKTELVYRDFKDSLVLKDLPSITFEQEDYGVAALGIEYVTDHQSGSESNIILETQHLVMVGSDKRESVIPFQRDLLLSLRHSLNDIQGKEFIFTAIADLEFQKELLLSLKYSQRLSENWKSTFQLRYVDAPPNSEFDISGIRPLHNDHQLDLILSRFF